MITGGNVFIEASFGYCLYGKACQNEPIHQKVTTRCPERYLYLAALTLLG
jgi:hypothetical protein